jgi:hypothetical protein
MLVIYDDPVITKCLLYSYMLCLYDSLFISEALHQVLVIVVACKSMAVAWWSI